MKISWTIIYCIVFVQSLFFSLALTPLSRIMGKRLSLMDEPSAAKIHHAPKARSGGLAIFASFILVILLDLGLGYLLFHHGALLKQDVARLVANIPGISGQLLALLAGAAFIFLVGVVDDKVTMKPRTKLACQILSALPLLLAGVRIQLFLPSWAGILLTLFWIVLVTNSFNLLDNMDGLSSGIAVIVSLVLAFVSWQAQDRFMCAILICLAGSILGFWYFNFIKSKLFMGDGGSLFIGYMIGALTIQATYYKQGVPTGLPVLTPLIILGVPLFDTASVIYIRLRAGRPIMKGDTNHFSHRLADLGMSRKQAVLFIYLVTICVALTALPLAYLPLRLAVIQAALVVIWFVIIFLIELAGKKKREQERKLEGN